MTRSLLQPNRIRPTAPPPHPARRNAQPKSTTFSPGTRRTLAAIGALWLSFAAASAGASPASQPSSPDLIERGRYIVEGVGLCGDCHTPRTEKGEMDRNRWLLGSALPFQPTVPMPWSPAAPPIAGLPTMTREQGIVFLTTGKRPDGSLPRPPMPEFRLSHEDASAVVAYLKSLTK